MPALHLAYDYCTGDPDIDVTATEIRILREQADQLSATATARTGAAAAQLVDRGFSVRDVATILGISPQRVSQLTDTTKASRHRAAVSGGWGVGREAAERNEEAKSLRSGSPAGPVW